MNTKNQQTNSHASFLSIDEWQDDETRAGSWFDNPFLGALCVLGALVCLFSLSAVSSQAEANRLKQAREDAEESLRQADALNEDHAEPTTLDKALARLSRDRPEQSWRYLTDKTNFDPGQKRVVQDKIMEILATAPLELSNNFGIFSVWFDTDDSLRISALLRNSTGAEARCLVEAMAKLPNPVPALFAELSEHPANGDAFQALEQELCHHHNVQSAEISRQLASKLHFAVNPQNFERIVLSLKRMSWKTGDDSELKKLIAGAMASASRNLMLNQLEKMDANIPDAITTFAQLPENSDLLEKLAAASNGTASVMKFLGYNKKSKEAGDFAVKLARENKIDPRQLYENTELTQQLKWEGILKGYKEFLDLNMNSGVTSMRGFSNAGVSLIDSDPDSAIDLLLSVVQRERTDIAREGMSDEFLRKIDALLADKLKDDLRLPSTSSNTDKKGSPASLDLAERLGGRNAALAIAKAGTKKPEVLREFKGMLGAMIALNEPETYGMIVNAWVIHGDVDGLENIGEAIESKFITRLQVRLKKLNAADKQQRRVIHFLMSALKQIGTTESLPVLNELTESKLVGFQKASAEAIKIIRNRLDRR